MARRVAGWVVGVLGVLWVATAGAWAARPVARWDVVPDQVLDRPMNLGVVAFHPEGVRVEFRIDDKVVATAENPKLNEHSGVWEYWFTLDPKQYPDGPVTIAARAISLKEGEPTYDLPPLQMYANGSGSLTVNHVTWADANGGDDAAGDGSEERPFKTLARALKATPAGGTVYLKAGVYSADRLEGGVKRDYWTTIQAAPGVERDQVEVSQGRPGAQRIRWKDLTIFCERDDGKFSPILMGGNGLKVWLDNVKATNKKGRWAANAVSLNMYSGGSYITGGVTSDMSNGPGASLVRGHRIEKIASDAWSGSQRLVVNSECEDIDRGPTEAHPDFYQSFARDPNWCEDVILYNVKGFACNCQGLFGARLRNSAFVNVLFERVPEGNFLSQFSPPVENVMFFHVNIVNQNWLWRESREDATAAMKDVRVINSVFNSMSLFRNAKEQGLEISHNHFRSGDKGMGTERSTGDVMYVNPAGRDYRLKEGSPAIGTGKTLQCVPADIEGKEHPAEGRNRGCYSR